MAIVRTNLHQIQIEEETTYGTDVASSPVDLRVWNLAMVEPEYNAVPKKYGDYVTEDNFVSQKTKTISFDVPLSQADSNDTEFALDYLIKACGYKQGATKSLFDDLQPGFPGSSISIHPYVGGIDDLITGARGTMSIILNVGEVARAHFEFTGIYNSVSDTARPGSKSFAGSSQYVVEANTMSYNTTNYHISSVEYTDNNEVVVVPSASNSDQNGIYQVMILNKDPEVTFNPLVEDTTASTFETAIENSTESNLLHERYPGGTGEGKNPVLTLGTIITDESREDEDGALRFGLTAKVTTFSLNLECTV